VIQIELLRAVTGIIVFIRMGEEALDFKGRRRASLEAPPHSGHIGG
jgi:hypothetical protein